MAVSKEKPELPLWNIFRSLCYTYKQEILTRGEKKFEKVLTKEDMNMPTRDQQHFSQTILEIIKFTPEKAINSLTPRRGGDAIIQLKNAKNLTRRLFDIMIEILTDSKLLK